MFDVILPKRVTPQPVPAIMEGGDCSACVWSGVLGLEVEEVYRRFDPDKTGFSRFEMLNAALIAKSENLLDRVIHSTPFWFDNSWATHDIWGRPSWSMGIEWFQYILMAMDAGYYGITSVRFDQDGPKGGSDHCVLLCGARERQGEAHTRPNGETIGHRILQEVLVSCSNAKTPDEEWVEVGAFLKQRGGYNVILVRPWLEG